MSSPASRAGVATPGPVALGTRLPIHSETASGVAGLGTVGHVAAKGSLSVMFATELFPPTRHAGLARLQRFLPSAGRDYARDRNIDFGPGRPGAVSQLSPYVRYRLVNEPEIVARVLEQHGLAASEKYVQEVLWRTYWKGWLELHPGVWTRFLDERDRDAENFTDTRAVADAEAGRTGLEGFDDWARELVETGYLHNHVRMWFASIWIFTLGLPWTLGADFFLRHLIDADAASNTLSWRWVAGLQTPGKTYLATTENIARFTNGRFAPTGLARVAVALTEPTPDLARTLQAAQTPDPDKPALLLVTSEDLNPGDLRVNRGQIRAVSVVADDDLLWGDAARRFVRAAASDTATRHEADLKCPVEVRGSLRAEDLIVAAQAANALQLITAYAPVGPTAESLLRITPDLEREGLKLVQVRRDWDSRFWPHAKAGFFSFKKQIPAILAQDRASSAGW